MQRPFYSQTDQKQFILNHYQTHAFSHILCMLFSTRALELLNTCAQVEKKATLFGSKKRRFFFALFRTIRKVRPNAFEYQCVAKVNFVYKISPKITAFSGLSFRFALFKNSGFHTSGNRRMTMKQKEQFDWVEQLLEKWHRTQDFWRDLIITRNIKRDKSIAMSNNVCNFAIEKKRLTT